MARREAPRNPAGGSLGDRIRFHAIRWVPLLVTALVTYGLFPPPAGVLSRVPELGRLMDRTVVAPFPFQVRKTTDEMAREGEARALTAQPVYRFSPTAYDSALAAARDFFADLERASDAGAGADARGRRRTRRTSAPRRPATWPTRRTAARCGSW